MKKLNKKGADKIISVYWFAILFIVAAGIAYMVFAFYGKPYDVRDVEANAIASRIAACVSKGGYLQEESLQQGFKENFMDVCNLNFSVEDAYGWREEGQYYTEIEILDFTSQSKLSEMSSGNANLKTFCELKGDKLPVCLKRSLYSIDQNNKQYQINILSIVRKTEKNAL